MRFNRHSEYEGRHAFLSASKPAWLNYEDDKLVEAMYKSNAAYIGTLQHEFANMAIRLGNKMPNNTKTINLYVNDCIGYRMSTEQTLVYSPRAFGTADAIGFEKGPDGRPILRLFDLKTGTGKAYVTQLIIYAAYFCLEYKVKPMTIDYDLRIYQNDDVQMFETDPEDVAYVMDRVIQADKILKEIQEKDGVFR